jgi:hypothetical protein
MSRRSNKWIAEILTPSSPSVEPTTNVCTSSQSSIRNENIHDIELARKMTIATEGFTTHKFCELVLKDRNPKCYFVFVALGIYVQLMVDNYWQFSVG